MAGHVLAKQGRREAELPVGVKSCWAPLGSPAPTHRLIKTGHRQLQIRAKKSGRARIEPPMSLLSLKS